MYKIAHISRKLHQKLGFITNLVFVCLTDHHWHYDAPN